MEVSSGDAPTMRSKYLASALVVIWLSTTSCSIDRIRHALLYLLLGTLGGIGSQFLLGLGAEIFATGVRHDCKYCSDDSILIPCLQ